MTCNDLSKEIHQGNVERGFYDTKRPLSEVLVLIHAEISEAVEADRKEKFTKTVNWKELMELPDEEFKAQFQDKVKDTYEDEIADTMIRLLDLIGWQNLDIDNHMAAKLRYNSLRPYRHGKKY